MQVKVAVEFRGLSHVIEIHIDYRGLSVNDAAEMMQV